MAAKIWAEATDMTAGISHNEWVRLTRIDTWIGKAKHWALLVRQGANAPEHPLHETTYLPLYKWLVNHQSHTLGFPKEESSE